MCFPIIQTRWIPGDGCIATKQRVGQFYHTPPTKWKLSCNSELTSSHFIDAMLYFVEISTKRNVCIHGYLTTYYLQSYVTAEERYSSKDILFHKYVTFSASSTTESNHY